MPNSQFRSYRLPKKLISGIIIKKDAVAVRIGLTNNCFEQRSRTRAPLLALMTFALFCACVEKKTGSEIPNPPSGQKTGGQKTKLQTGKGVWHTVEPGQTLWRICKAYGVDMEKVIKENQIDDPADITVGDRIFIPGATKVLQVEPAPQLASAPKTGPKNSEDGKDLKLEPPDRFPPENNSGSGKLRWPVEGGTIFSKFGSRNGQFHEGCDISAPEGTAIYAADDGKVVYSGDRIRGYGNMIVIKHAGNLSTVYAHNRTNLVSEGDFVRRGQKIAEVGKTGNATGCHLHFEVRVGKEAVDPLKYVEKGK